MYKRQDEDIDAEVPWQEAQDQPMDGLTDGHPDTRHHECVDCKGQVPAIAIQGDTQKDQRKADERKMWTEAEGKDLSLIHI